MDTLKFIEKVLDLLQCPECRQDRLTFAQPEALLRCECCGKGYPSQNGILDLLREQDRPLAKKAFGKRYTQWYDAFAYRGSLFRLYRWRLEDEFNEYTHPVKLQPVDIVVDVGCGTGNYTLQFARKLNEGIAIGVDLSIAMLELLIQHAQKLGIKNMVAIRANAENLPFKEGSLVKVFNGCLHHLSPSIQPCLEETYRCLSPGGICFGKTLFAAPPVLPKMVQQVSALAMSARPILPSRFAQELERVGFRNISIHPGGRDQFFFGYYSMVK